MAHLRAKPQNLVMAEHVPFGQQFTYHDGLAVKEMLDPEFFLSLANNIRVGDKIDLIRVGGGRVREVGEARVIAVSKTAIEMALRGEIQEFAHPDAPKADAAPKDERYVEENAKAVHRGNGSYDVVGVVSGKVFAKGLSKEDAEATARGDKLLQAA